MRLRLVVADVSDREIVGDSVEHTVRWKNRTAVKTIAGRPVRVRFVLKDADIFSFQFVSKDASP